jgi:profilin
MKKSPVIYAVRCTAVFIDGWNSQPRENTHISVVVLPTNQARFWQPRRSSSQESTATMSWQEYVDDHLLAELASGGRLSQGAIIGHGGQVWAQSEGFPALTDLEVQEITHEFSNPGAIAAKGLFLGGTKYLVIPGDPGEVIRGRKNVEGVTIKKTVSALVIGIYGEGVQAGEANTVVENLGDYLISQGY